MLRAVIRIVFITLLVSSASVAHADWRRAETSRFVAYSDISEHKTQRILADLHAFDAMLRSLFGVAPDASPNRLEIYLLSSLRQLDDIFPGTRDGVLGAYTSRAGATVFAAYAFETSPITQDGISAQQVIFHEYAHHFMYQHFNGAYPAWFIEGFAEFVATAEIDSKEAKLGYSSPGRARTLSRGNWLDIDNFLTMKASGSSRQAAGQLYAQAWLTVHYFYTDAGREAALRSFFEHSRQTPEQILLAFETATGQSRSKFNRTLRRYGRRGLPIITVPLEEMVDLQINFYSLTPTNAKLVIPSARLRLGPADEEEISELRKRIANITQDAPVDANILTLRAHAASWGKDFDLAEQFLNDALNLDPKKVESLHLAGLVNVLKARDLPANDARAARILARTYFDRAIAQEPTYYQSHFHRAETFSDPILRIEALIEAWRLAPQVNLISLRLGRELVNEGYSADAIGVLAPVAAQPHGGQSAKQAQTLLDRISETTTEP